MKTLKLSDKQLSELSAAFEVRNVILARNYVPGDWNKFMQANARIAEALWPSLLAQQGVQAA